VEFSVSDKMQSMLAAIRDFLESEVYPIESEVARQGFRASLPLLKEKRDKVKELGLWAPQVPVEHGGLGLSNMEHGMVSAELGRSPLGHYLFNCPAPDAGNMEILHLFGTPAQQEQFLKPLVNGEIRSCFSMTEPEFAGSNPTRMATTAVKDGNDYVINGHKWFTTAADGAGFAIVMAITDPAAAPHSRASQIIVPMDTPGVQIVRNIPIMGEEGSDWLSHSEMRYENVRVPQSNLLGKEGEGFAIAQERLGPGRIHHCMRWMGICERSFDLMCERAATRELAPGELLGSKQTIQNWIAESRAEINAAKLMVLQAAWKMDQVGAKQAREEISLIKFFSSKILLDVVDRAMQVHGALGMTEDTPLSHFYRHERGARIYDGADEVHKSVIAKRILKRYGLSL
jgi:alkylation response protein AidB-like acyl-CoA dehydrogenase